MMSRIALQEFWQHPGVGNQPADYVTGEARSQLLLELVGQSTTPEMTVLEIGCNVGRNLATLHRAGWTRLSGVDINPDALALYQTTFPDAADDTRLVCAPVEDAIREYADQAFGLVYTMACLQHLHPESHWVFADIARITKTVLITVEDEHATGERHWARSYARVFEPLGFQQERVTDCLEVEGLGRGFMARQFRRVGCPA